MKNKFFTFDYICAYMIIRHFKNMTFLQVQTIFLYDGYRSYPSTQWAAVTTAICPLALRTKLPPQTCPYEPYHIDTCGFKIEDLIINKVPGEYYTSFCNEEHQWISYKGKYVLLITVCNIGGWLGHLIDPKSHEWPFCTAPVLNRKFTFRVPHNYIFYI